MTYLRHIGYILLLVLLLPACSGSQSIITLEILEPAAITYPVNVHTIGYLNRSPISLNSFEAINKETLNDTDLYMIDTIICLSIIEGFAEGKSKAQLGYLDQIVYLEARRNDTLYRDSAISNEKVKEICESYGLDALITQDYYAFKFDKIIGLLYDYYDYKQVHILIHDLKWSINIPGLSKPLDVYTFHDTLYYGNQATYPIEKYLTPLEMLADASHSLGYAYGIRNTPVWNELYRIVYVGIQKELRKARVHTNKGNWEKAHHIWSQCLTSENEKLAAKAAHNIAVYYEMEDEIEQALAFSRKASELWPSPRIESYMQELEVRMLNKNDVIKQLRVEDE